MRHEKETQIFERCKDCGHMVPADQIHQHLISLCPGHPDKPLGSGRAASRRKLALSRKDQQPSSRRPTSAQNATLAQQRREKRQEKQDRRQRATVQGKSTGKPSARPNRHQSSLDKTARKVRNPVTAYPGQFDRADLVGVEK